MFRTLSQKDKGNNMNKIDKVKTDSNNNQFIRYYLIGKQITFDSQQTQNPNTTIMKYYKKNVEVIKKKENLDYHGYKSNL